MQDKMPLVIAAFLTWIAGFVDAVGFLSLGHLYTANMSGNSVALGFQLSWQNWPEAVRRILPVISYIIGLLFCRILIEFGARERIRFIASLTWLCEIALLVPACASHVTKVSPSSAAFFVYVGLLAIAMGIQNATLTHFSSLTLNTGFVTGTLVKFAEQLTKYLAWLYDRVRSEDTSFGRALAASRRQHPFRATVWLGIIWIAYVLGACCGGLSDSEFRLRSLLAPIVSLIVLIGIDLRKPLGILEEQEQRKLSA